MTKRPDGCRPAACTSNPAARASSRNSARLRSLPPTKTIISKDGDGSQSSSGDTPPRTGDATCGTRRPWAGWFSANWPGAGSSNTPLPSSGLEKSVLGKVAHRIASGENSDSAGALEIARSVKDN